MNNYEPILCHHGILGQKWGVRRYQNPDGSLTKAGRRRLNKDAEQLGYYQSHINENRALARFEKNPYKSMMYEWGQQFKYEKYYDDLYNKMIEKYGDKNLKDITDNPYYKKTAERGQKWWELAVNSKPEDMHSINNIFTQLTDSKSPLYAFVSNKQLDKDMYEFVKNNIGKDK